MSLIIFQAGWFLIVLGSRSLDFLWIIPCLSIFVWAESRTYQLSLRQHRARFLLAIIGFSFDSVLQNLQLISFQNQTQSGAVWFAPLWLFLLWVWFAYTFSNCYRVLQGHYFLALSIGVIFGPLAYWSASLLSRVMVIQPILFTLFSGIFWGALFYGVFAIKRVNRLLVCVNFDGR